MKKIRKPNNTDFKLNQFLNEAKIPRNREVNVEFIDTGSAMLNMAFSGDVNAGLPRARVINFVGDGSSGKTIIALSCAFNFLKTIDIIPSRIFPKVKKKKVIYNNGEAVMDFPIKKMFGEKFEKLVDWKRSKYIESAGKDFIKQAFSLKKGESLLYIIDSWDSFRSIHQTTIEDNQDDENAKAYDFPKQKYAWKFFAEVCDVIEDNKIDATLIIISQTKSKIGVKFGKKKYRTGGDALNFYTHLVPWLRVVKKHEKTKFGEKRVYAIDCEASVERTKVGLPFRKANFRILLDYGIDDITSMGQYLRSHKINEFRGIPLKDLHKFAVEIEKRDYHQRLRDKVFKVWNKVENGFQEEINQRSPNRL